MNKQDRREKTLNHLSRIEGQLATLKSYILAERPCHDIAMLSTSIAKSFDTLRTRTLEGFIHHELLAQNPLPEEKLDELHKLFELYKK